MNAHKDPVLMVFTRNSLTWTIQCIILHREEGEKHGQPCDASERAAMSPTLSRSTVPYRLQVGGRDGTLDGLDHCVRHSSRAYP